MATLENVIRLLYTGFAEAVIILFLLRFFTGAQQDWLTLLVMANSILWYAALAHAGLLLLQLSTGWYTSATNEQADLSQRISGPYWYLYWGLTITPVAASQVFWSKRLRRRISVSFLLLPLLFAETVVSYFIVRFGTFRDARPAAWISYAPRATDYLVPVFVFGLLLAAAYYVSGIRSAKTKK